MNKRGVSGVVTTVLLVVISIVAVAVVWNVVGGIIKSSTEDIESMDFTMNFEIEKVEIIDGLTANVKIKRGAGKGECSKLKIILTGAKDSQIHETTECLEELETKTFSIDLEVIPEKVEVAPIIGTDKGEKTGNLADSLEDKNFIETYNNLVGYWKLDGNANDETGVNHGIINGADCNVEGKVGKSCKFDGLDDWIDMGAAPTLNQDFEEISVEFWIYAESITGSDAGLVGKGTNRYGTTYHSNWKVYFYGGGKSRFSVGLDEWHHILGVFNGPEMKRELYLDGLLVAEGASIYTSTGTGGLDFRIGRATTYFNGNLDEVKIYNKALTEEQVLMLYNSYS